MDDIKEIMDIDSMDDEKVDPPRLVRTDTGLYSPKQIDEKNDVMPRPTATNKWVLDRLPLRRYEDMTKEDLLVKKPQFKPFFTALLSEISTEHNSKRNRIIWHKT